MAFCNQCGANINEEARFCTACGADQGLTVRPPEPPKAQPQYAQPHMQTDAAQPGYVQQSYAQPGYTQQSYTQQSYTQQPYAQPGYTNAAQKPSAIAQPMGVWAYVGSLLLMGIPLVGFILMIVWASGGTSNPNRRNLARAMLILMAIGILLGALLSTAIVALVRNVVQDLGMYDTDMSEYSEFFEEFEGFDNKTMMFEPAA